MTRRYDKHRKITDCVIVDGWKSRMRASWVGSFILILVAAMGGGWCSSSCKSTSHQEQQQGKKALVLVSEGIPQDQLWRQDFTFADMDGDGVRDLVTAPPRKSKEPWPHIFLRKKDHWEQACAQVPRHGFPNNQEYIYGGVAVADFDGDGISEIVLAMHETGIRILKSQTKGPCGPWTEWRDLPQQMLHLRSRAIATADMNRDGRVDIVALSEAPSMDVKFATRGLLIFFNEVNGWRSQELAGSENLYGDDIAIGEVNGDDIPDIAIGLLLDSRSEFVWLSDGSGRWKPQGAGLPSYIVAWSVQLVDLDGDGRDELVMGAGGAPFHHNAGPRVYHWNGKIWQDASEGLPQVSWVSGVTAADLDGDGRKELVAAEMYTGVVSVYKRSSEGLWTEQLKITIPDPEGLRNYKVKTWRDDNTEQEQVAANFVGGNTGKILVWAWR